MYYDICPDCGAALDPGERCDCKKNAADAANINGGGAAWMTAIPITQTNVPNQYTNVKKP